MKLFYHLSLIIFLLSGVTGFATEYHVNHSNSSSGDGTEGNPFQTIKQAADIMVAGDVCYIHKGTYRETLNPVNSGTAASPIRLTSFPGDTVIISATSSVSGWQSHAGNIYKANVSMNQGLNNNVYLDYEKMQLARWPNDVDNNEYSLNAKFINTSEGTYSMSYISNNEIPNIDWTGGTIHYLGAHSGCSWERSITDYDNSSRRVHFAELPSNWPFGTHSPPRYENGHRGIFYLMDKLEALDYPREWYYDEGTTTLYFYAPDGNMPEDEKVEFVARGYSVELNGNYIEIDNLNFFGGTVRIRGDYNKMTQCMVKHASNRLITNNGSATRSNPAIFVNGADFNVIEKCVIENGTTDGIIIDGQSDDNRVENCIVQYFNTMGLHACLIRSHGLRNKILKNSLYGSARDGSRVTGEDSEFAYNHVQKCLISGADGGLFYVTGNSVPKNIELHHNWFNDAYSDDAHAGHKATGIYLDNDAAGFIVHHNVVWDVEWGGLHFNWDALENEIYNNTFWAVGDVEQSVIDSWVPERNGVRTNVRDNTLYNNFSDVRPWWHSGAGSFRIDENEWSGAEADNEWENNEQFADMPFISMEGKNFMPNEGSPLIDAGQEISGITDGFNDDAPDLGAYEYGSEYWVAGADWIPQGFAWTPGTDYLAINGEFIPSVKINEITDQILQTDLNIDVNYTYTSTVNGTVEIELLNEDDVVLAETSKTVRFGQFGEIRDLALNASLELGHSYEIVAILNPENDEFTPVTDTLKNVTVYDPDSSVDELPQSAFKIYPNPANNNISIDFEYGFGDIETVEIIGVAGIVHTFQAQNSGEGKLNLDISSLENGIYVIRVLTNKHVLKSKFVKGL
ncbi:T9SS type A sorting domain-containing protein [Labilibacter marinus]|uniref:T9SS type A sorting domain-containing protein n=1 Tax=Labilibacter marinus TaxID=1477105 RepID=UPI000832B46D|nr:T9SS type A sorting domain-containing protein [Labilibacter marinus]